MEKGISFLEGFGDFDQGDGFQAESAAVAQGASVMSACAIFRFDSYDLSGTLLTDDKLIAGNFGPNNSGWGFRASPGSVEGVVGGAPASYSFGDGDKPVAGRPIVCHVTVVPPPPPSQNDPAIHLYVQGTLVAQQFGIGGFGQAGFMSIGAGAEALAQGLQPFGDSADIPSARSGVAGVSYGEFSMSDADVAEHYRQILEAEDLANGDLGWINLWSVRRGMPDLEVAGGDSAEWVDEIGGAVLTRTQFNQQTPSMSVGVRPARLY